MVKQNIIYITMEEVDASNTAWGFDSVFQNRDLRRWTFVILEGGRASGGGWQ